MIVRVSTLVLVLLLGDAAIVSAQSWLETYEDYLTDGKYESGEARYEDASHYFGNAYSLALANKDTLRVFESGNQLISTLYWLYNFDQMIDLGNELENYYTPSIPDNIYANIADWLAYAYAVTGDPTSSLDVLDRIITRVDSVNFPFDYADALYDAGVRLVGLGRYHESLIYKKRALVIFEEIQNSKANNTYLAIYVSYLYLGDIDTGISYLLRSCDYAEENSNTILLAQCYYYLGDYFERKHDFSKAITNFEKSSRVAEESVYPSLSIRANHELGVLYKDIDEIETALVYFNRMYELSEAANLIKDEMIALTNLGICYRLLGEYSEAERLLFEAYNFYQSSDLDLDRTEGALLIADLYIDLDQQEQALLYIDEAYELGVHKQLERVQLSALNRYVKLDDSYISKQEKLALSKDVYRFASSFAESMNLSGLRTLATAYSEVYPDSAILYAEQALDIIERLRLSVSNGQLKMGAFSEYASFYNEIGSWYAEHKGNYTKAFELFESAKSRTLVDQLAEAKTDGLNEIPMELEIQFLQLQKQIDRLYREKETAPLSELKEINNQIVDAELAYQAAYENMRKENPILEEFEYPDPISLNETQKLLDSKTAVIQYALLENGIGIMLVKNKNTYYQTVVLQDDFSNHLSLLINTFRSSIIDIQPLRIIEQNSDPLYDILFSPIDEHLIGIENLIIVPDGAIALLPFDALIHNGEFLGKQFLLKNLPSVTAFSLIEKPNRTESNDLLAVAGSGINSGDSITRSSIQRGYAALPFTLIEVDTLADKFDEARVLKNQFVSEASIKNLDLDQYKYLHFATHGDINELAPTQSGLVLSKKDDMESLFGEDGLLNAQEIAQLSLNADMVVLSACNTANGRVISGEGLLGLQRSFLIAGASSVVSSLWSIYDRSTPIFMNAFYEHLQETEEDQSSWFNNILNWINPAKGDLIDYKSIALHQTKLEMMNHPYYSHPVHWASFVITGK